MKVNNYDMDFMMHFLLRTANTGTTRFSIYQDQVCLLLHFRVAISDAWTTTPEKGALERHVPHEWDKGISSTDALIDIIRQLAYASVTGITIVTDQGYRFNFRTNMAYGSCSDHKEARQAIHYASFMAAHFSRDIKPVEVLYA